MGTNPAVDAAIATDPLTQLSFYFVNAMHTQRWNDHHKLLPSPDRHQYHK